MLCSSVTAVPVDSELLHLLMRVFEKMKKKLVLNESEVWSSLDAVCEVGIDQVGERVFETSHPYERGKA